MKQRIIIAFATACLLAVAVPTTSAQTWTWVKGRTNVNGLGTYGSLGTAAGANTPGARYGAASWKGTDGKFYLFGGQGGATSGNGYLADLWRFDPATTNWTWIKGPNGQNSNGVHGTLGAAAATNRPGGRQDALAWSDGAGNLYLFGGYGYGESGGVGRLNDVWKFNTTTTNWTWVKGGKGTNAPGVYGTPGVAAAANTPGGRAVATTWPDVTNAFYLFGGYGFPASGTDGELNDLWLFDPATTNWTWLKGFNGINSNGVHGVQGSPASTNVPGARQSSLAWQGTNGALFLFGGYGYSAAGGPGLLNDLWAFDPGTTNWTWVRGTNATNGTAFFGVMGVESATNTPGGCGWMSGARLSDGTVAAFAGYGLAGAGSAGDLNDLWQFNRVTTNWTLVRGSRKTASPGEYGGLGSASGDNTPGGRDSHVAWAGSNAQFYVFGGSGYDDNGTNGRLNDVWWFRPATNAVPLILFPNISIAEGDTGTNFGSFEVSLSFPATNTVTAVFYTTNVTAAAGIDYVPTNGLLTFLPGEGSKLIPLGVIGDTIVEGTEKFRVVVTNATNATLSVYPNQSGVVSITEVETVPTLLVTNAAVVEGDSGPVTMTFNISLSTNWPQSVTVLFATVDGTAVSAVNYLATNGMLTFAPGEQLKTVPVQVFGNETFDGDKTFTLVLSSPTNAFAGSAPGANGTGTILDDEDIYCRFISGDIVGYQNLSVPPGYSLNRFGILHSGFVVSSSPSPNLPEGASIFTIVNGQFRANNYLEGTWTDPQMALVVGQAWFFKNPAPTNIIWNTVAGDASGGCLHSLQPGLSACGSALPLGGSLLTDMNYTPTNGDVIHLHNNAGNTYTPYTYDTNSNTFPGLPALGVLQAFWIQKSIGSIWNDRLISGDSLSSTNCLALTPLTHPPATSQVGQLNFLTYNPANASLGRVFGTNGTTPLDATYLGQLYAGTNGSESSFVPLGAAVNFLGGSQAGYVRGSDVLVLFATGGQSVFVQLRAWKQSDGATYAAAAMPGNAVGKSAAVLLTTRAAVEGAAPGVPPLDVNNFASFALSAVPVGSPAMQVAAGNSNLVTLSWSPATPGFVLQFSDTLAPPNWSNAPSGSTNPITITATNQMRFYRVKY